MAKAVVDYGKETAMYALVVEKGRSRVLIEEIEQFADDFANEDDVVAVANHNSVTPHTPAHSQTRDIGKLMVVVSSGYFRDEGGVT
jgi:hypothetical protein